MRPTGEATALAFALLLFASNPVVACSDALKDGSPDVVPPPSEGERDGGVSPGEGATTPAPSVETDPGPAAIRFVGRFDRRDPVGPACAWPGCRIIANFEGASVSAKLAEQADDWMAGGPSEWDVAIDGVWQPKLVLERGPHDYVLATGLAKGKHRVELFKRSEAQNGVTQFLGYDFGGGVLLPPPPAANRRIEVIGDSTPAAYGSEAATEGPNCAYPTWAAHWENFRHSFATHLGETFSADVVGTAYSGKGVVQNATRTDTDTIPLIYPLANPLDHASAFDVTSYVPDVVILMMGSNDFTIGEPYDDGPPSLSEFTDGFRRFVGTVRTNYPRALVVLAISPSVTDDAPAGRQSRTNVLAAMTTVQAERAAAGDDRMTLAVPKLATPDELTGCNGHGTPAFHVRVASELSVVIAAKMGW